MIAPTLHERRPDAEVYVYGDDAPISDAEWHCARLVWALYDGGALDIDADVLRPLVRAGGGNIGVSRATRAEAVADLTKTLAEMAETWAKVYAERSLSLRREAAARMAGAEANEARAARLRALLAGGDRG